MGFEVVVNDGEQFYRLTKTDDSTYEAVLPGGPLQGNGTISLVGFERGQVVLAWDFFNQDTNPGTMMRLWNANGELITLNAADFVFTEFEDGLVTSTLGIAEFTFP